ncbi:zf-HC2 domain-containing protein [candidate division KSB1 bacterium]
MNKKECNISREIIIDFLLKELSYEETIELDAHLRECGSCRSQANSLLKLFKKVDNGQESVSSDTYLKLKKKVFGKSGIENERRLTRNLRRTQVFSFIVSAAAVLMISLLIGNQFSLFSPFSTEDEGALFFTDSSLVNFDVNNQKYDTLIIIDKNKYFKEVEVYPTKMIDIEHLTSPSDVTSIHEVRQADFFSPPVELFRSLFSEKKIISRVLRKKPPKYNKYIFPSDRSIRYLI